MEGTQNHGKARGEEENLNCEKLQCTWRETFYFSSFPFVLCVNEVPATCFSDCVRWVYFSQSVSLAMLSGHRDQDVDCEPSCLVSSDDLAFVTWLLQ